MIQNYLNFKDNVTSINEHLGRGGKIQKLYSTKYLIEFHIRTSGKTHIIHMGRGNGVEGLWYSEVRVNSDYRLRDRFLEFLRAHIKNDDGGGQLT